MAEAITDLVEGAMGSPWVYLALCAFAAIDAFFPVVPSESLVISAGVFAAPDSAMMRSTPTARVPSRLNSSYAVSRIRSRPELGRCGDASIVGRVYSRRPAQKRR